MRREFGLGGGTLTFLEEAFFFLPTRRRQRDRELIERYRSTGWLMAWRLLGWWVGVSERYGKGKKRKRWEENKKSRTFALTFKLLFRSNY